MVSYPVPSETLFAQPPPSTTHSLPPRRPSSVSSRTSATTARRHRHNRSYGPQNEFPVFAHTGDVEIVITSGRKTQRYLLHRLILAQCSGFFEAGTSGEWSRDPGGGPGAAGHGAPGQGALSTIGESEDGSSSTGRGSTEDPTRRRRWRYELDWGRGEDDIPMLVQKSASSSLFGGDDSSYSPPSRPKPTTSHTTPGFFRQITNFSSLTVSQAAPDPVDETLRDYDNLFRIFYNYPPNLDAVSLPHAYVECKSLLQLADMYDALEVVGPRVDHHLLRFQGRLWKQIAKYPPSYLKLGYLARSKVIFSEALIHVVGQWPSGANQLRGQVPDAVIHTIEDKVDDLEEMKAKIEGKLFRLTLTTSRGERVTPSNNFTDWLAMSLFRQWLAENTTPQPTSILKDSSAGGRAPSSRGSGTANSHSSHAPPPSSHPSHLPPAPLNTGRIYRLIGTAGTSYLGHEECKRFLKSSPLEYNRDTLKRLERRLEEIKNLARDVVKPLMRNFLELDLKGEGGGGLPYLSCTRVEDVDLPWDP